MNVEELKESIETAIDSWSPEKNCINISIQFAIEVLGEIGTSECTEISTDDLLWAKIEELKKYLK